MCVRLTTSGNVERWGDSFGGALFPALFNGACDAGGDSYCTPTKTIVPTVFSPPNGIPVTADALSVGAYVGVALKGGSVVVWGNDSYGQSGLGLSLSPGAKHFDPRALAVPPMTAVSAVGGLTTLLLDTGGNVWALGWGPYGQIGNGVFVTTNCPQPPPNAGDCQDVPVKLLSPTGVAKIRSGINNSAAITNDGKLWMWGANYEASLGHAPNLAVDGTCPGNTTANPIEALQPYPPARDHPALRTSTGRTGAAGVGASRVAAGSSSMMRMLAGTMLAPRLARVDPSGSRLHGRLVLERGEPPAMRGFRRGGSHSPRWPGSVDGAEPLARVEAPATSAQMHSRRRGGTGYSPAMLIARTIPLAAVCSVLACDPSIVGMGRSADLAHRYEVGLGVEKDEGRAVQLYTKGCDDGDLAACASLGAMITSGRGAQRNDALAIQLFLRACDRGGADGCAKLGVMYGSGSGVAKDEARAAELYKRACDGGSAAGCDYLGDAYDRGYGVLKDAVRAAELFRRACDGGWLAGCFDLGVMYENGRGVPDNTERAAQLYKQACDGGSAAGCGGLGGLYARGGGVPRDDARALALSKSACDRGDPPGCITLGVLHEHGQGVTRDTARAVALYRQACDKFPDFCTYLGVMYESGEGVAKDETRAVELYKRACETGSSRGCEYAGNVLTSAQMTLGSDMLKVCRAGEAEAALREALAIRERVAGAASAAVVEPLQKLAEARWQMSDDSGSERLLARAMTVLDAREAWEAERFTHMLATLAAKKRMRRDFAGAATYEERAIAVAERHLDTTSPAFVEAVDGFAATYRAQGKEAAATALLQRLHFVERVMPPGATADDSPPSATPDSQGRAARLRARRARAEAPSPTRARSSARSLMTFASVSTVRCSKTRTCTGASA